MGSIRSFHETNVEGAARVDPQRAVEMGELTRLFEAARGSAQPISADEPFDQCRPMTASCRSETFNFGAAAGGDRQTLAPGLNVEDCPWLRESSSY